MLFMLIVKATHSSENGGYPNAELNRAMSKYNEELIKTGVRVMSKGIYPSSNGMRFAYVNPGKEPIVTVGPFESVHELITGFILIDVKSREEAIEWARKMPDPMGNGEGQIELRQIIE